MARESNNIPVKYEIDCYSDCCRACMCRKLNMKSVFSTELSRTVEELQFSTGILITQNDGLPKLVCEECLKMLSVAYKFKTTCLQSDEMFRNMLKHKVKPEICLKVEVQDDCNSADNNEVCEDDGYHQVTKLEVEMEFDETGAFDSGEEVDGNEMPLTPVPVSGKPQVATSTAIPERSGEQYLSAYEHFTKWRKTVNKTSFSENVLMDYFKDLIDSYKYKPASLWAKYSMLKTVLKTKHDVDIKDYLKLIAFLRKLTEGYKSKKSQTLSASDIERFINEAPDDRYLAIKVALIFGITGACKRGELAKITTKDIETHGETLLIKIPSRKTQKKVPSSFIVHGEFYKIVKTYESKRNPKCKSDKFFQNYQKGICMPQAIGLNRFGTMPKDIAKFLKLPDAESFTGHSFRRAALLLTDSEADITVRRHGGWTSNTVEEKCMESIENPIKMEVQIKDENYCEGC